MKKVLVLTALLGLMVSPAGAAMLNDFESETPGDVPAAGYMLVPNHLDPFYISGNHTGSGYQADGGPLGTGDQYMRVTHSAPWDVSAGSWFVSPGAGTYQIRFDYTIVDIADTKLPDLWVGVAENNGFTGNSSKITNSGKLSVGALSSSSFDIDSEVVVLNSAGSVAWTSYTTASFTLDAADTHFFVGFEFDDVDSDKFATPEYIGIDNVELIPEPATMGLLAIGGIGMLLRRRR